MDNLTKSHERLQDQFATFEGLKLEMNDFLIEMDQKLTTKQQLVSQADRSHNHTVAELTKVDKNLLSQLQHLKQKEQNTRDRLDRELSHLETLKHKIEDLASVKSELLKNKEKLDQDIFKLSDAIEQSKAELQISTDSLKRQMATNSLELAKYELYAGLVINVLSENQVEFGFTYVDLKDIDREFRVVLKIEGGTGTGGSNDNNGETETETETEAQTETETGNEKVTKKDDEEEEAGEGWNKISVIQTEPELSRDFLILAQDTLNENGDLAKFLKLIRSKFRELTT